MLRRITGFFCHRSIPPYSSNPPLDIRTALFSVKLRSSKNLIQGGNPFTGPPQKKLYPNTSYTHKRLFSPFILLENSIPASRSDAVKSTSGMMELRLSNDVTMGKSNRNIADVGFILRLCSNAPTFLRFRRRKRF